MTAPTSTSQASDPWEMALIHSLIRRGFEQAREAVLAPGAPARADAVAEYVGFHLDGLEAHHSSEDELLWPVLYERASHVGRTDSPHGRTARRPARRPRDDTARTGGVGGRTHPGAIGSTRDGPRTPSSTG